VTIYVKPQLEDWDPKNAQKSKISLKMEEDRKFFDEILQIELQYNSRPEIINRGMNII
jgi:DNA polymerase III epsilon subunit-like protein